MSMAGRETDLYLPLKRFLEAQGYEVKAEVNGCDVVARRGNGEPLIVELKRGFTLKLIYQAVDRLALSDTVYIAVGGARRSLPAEAVKLCRRLGLGLIFITKSGSLEVLAEPAPYAPRKNAKRSAGLLKEFVRRKGDPNLGGSTGTKLMTAYKQDALRCLRHLHSHGASKPAVIAKATAVERAASILRSNYYGWFTREARGIYALSEEGTQATVQFAAHLAALIDTAG
ncbi:MAG: hypothetical protein KGO53_08425 [Alphaproteobacteria bacterium]|nr:hypothetical protein [Alphaproteobacteria bacterium]